MNKKVKKLLHECGVKTFKGCVDFIQKAKCIDNPLKLSTKEREALFALIGELVKNEKGLKQYFIDKHNKEVEKSLEYYFKKDIDSEDQAEEDFINAWLGCPPPCDYTLEPIHWGWYKTLTGEPEPKDFSFSSEQKEMLSESDKKWKKFNGILDDAKEKYSQQTNTYKGFCGVQSSKNRMTEILENTGKKESDGKLYYELSWEFIEEMAKRMQNNKGEKYPRFNWKKDIDIDELKQAINRHHIEVMKDNYSDGEEALGHIVSYACNSMMLWEQLKDKKR